MNPQTKTISLEDLPNYATEFAKKLKPGDCVCLSGNMGAGKTTFGFFLTKALLSETQDVFSSPTFTILNQYHGENGFVINHIDLYRLDHFDDLQDIDLLPYLESSNAITLIEWGEKFPELQEYYTHKLQFDFVANESENRLIEVSQF